jgi:heme oxygenase (mycobilin-producing)
MERRRMMQVFITSGTTEFLQSIQKKHPEAQIVIMENATNALAYYEGNNGEIFTSPRAYEAVDHVGEVRGGGFVAMNHIPVTDEGRPIFEDRFKDRQGKVEEMPGFKALRILRPSTGNTYIVLTLWEDEQSFHEWTESQTFRLAHQSKDVTKKEKPPYSAGESFVHHYRIVE